MDRVSPEGIGGISVMIPTYNRAGLLRVALESVKRLRLYSCSAVEVVVVDNNSTDATAQVVEESANGSPFPIRYVLERQQGLSYARNRCLNEARYHHVVYLDDDMQVSRNWLKGYLRAASLHADCVVGPVFPKFEGDLPDYVTPRILDSVTSPYSRRGNQMFVLDPEIAYEIPGCNFGVRKSVALAIGGFPPGWDRVGRSMLAGGDFEFGVRLVAAGYRVIYQPECAIEHLISREKLSMNNLRKRWAGLGATERALDHCRSARPDRSPVKRVFRVLRLAAASVAYRGRGNTSLAFQRELEARRAWSFMKTKPLRQISG